MCRRSKPKVPQKNKKTTHITLHHAKDQTFKYWFSKDLFTNKVVSLKKLPCIIQTSYILYNSSIWWPNFYISFRWCTARSGKQLWQWLLLWQVFSRNNHDFDWLFLFADSANMYRRHDLQVEVVQR